MTASLDLAESLGLTADEHERIVATLGREPTKAEIAMYAAMWSEHCSYKSSKIYLKTLPTEGPRVVMGPGENAGVVDIGDGLVAVFKIESHNHPSLVEPVQGAATGVGGIVRDIVSTGARPIAILDPLRFGALDEWRNRWLLGGVVAGISQYGNSIGIPTVGGEVQFDPCYRGNPLVNVLCLGIGRADRVIRARAERVGAVALLFGNKTGRDGIGGVSVLASRPFDSEAEAKRPSVQVGDPFAEKIAIEACLELAERGLLIGLQDLGGAGLCCATSETASRAALGMEVDLDQVPLREDDMEPFEILTSESQERMLAIVAPEDVAEAVAVCARWGVTAVAVGKVTEGDLVVNRRGEVVARAPARSLADEGPTYHRPARRPEWLDELRARDPLALPAPDDLGAALLDLLASPNICSKRWVFEQYDSLVQHGTLAGPGGDAAVLRVPGTGRALALSTDGNARYCLLDPRLGAAHAVAEAARNVACSGARPVSVTNCLNFGNPEDPGVMWQFAEAVAGMGEACRALATPVTGGNVSFYNQTEGENIHPTPVIGMLGVIEDASRALGIAWGAGRAVALLGETRAELGGSEWAWATHGFAGGAPPSLDLEAESRLVDLLASLAERELIESAHDCSQGGLGVTLAECAIASGIGAILDPATDLAPHAWLFSESATRAVVTCAPERLDDVLRTARAAGVPAAALGETGGAALEIRGVLRIETAALARAFEGALPAMLGA
ncbi:MAG: phosphoribosylformylglycinamidine synthase subunit PurL [Acidobacteria bacterium]|nr:phosphoribosylformylglycinamidine synthase subunit PurL [Acidobacteriota bacterium]